MRISKIIRSLGLLVIIGFISISSIGGCNNGSNAVLAILNLSESGVVPGRLVADASKSTTRNLEIVSYEFTVTDEATGETIAEVAFTDPEKSVFTPVVGQGTFGVRVKVTDNEGQTDTASAQLLTSGNCIADNDVAQCCVNSNSSPTQFTCVPTNSQNNLELLTGGDRASLVEIIQLLPGGSNVNENTVLWIQAWGGAGGNGQNTTITDGGVGGNGKLATTITTISEFESNFGTTQIYYYAGNYGTHSGFGGSGAASSIVATAASPASIDDIVVISGGGGGAGSGLGEEKGSNGADGAEATANADNPEVSNQGGSKDECTGGGAPNLINTGGRGATVDGNDGNGGEGGESAGAGPESWLNGDPNIGTNGMGGSSADSLGAGAGGGGFGGGGGAGDENSAGCGGGSVARGGSQTDNCAPVGTQNPDGNWDGQVIIVFNTNPNSCS